MPMLEAVVESPEKSIKTWVPLTAQSKPFYKIRLCSSTPADDVAQVVAQLTVYGRADKSALTMEQLVNEPVRILPGGLRVIDNKVIIDPSCCCGLETWREWLGLLTGDGSPWLGHDPAPWVENRNGLFIVHSDGGLGEDGEAAPDTRTQITFSRAELEAALLQVQKDLAGFLERLGEWALEHQLAFAEALGRAFDKWFQISEGGIE